MNAQDFATFEALWAALWEYIYKVLAYFGIELKAE